MINLLILIGAMFVALRVIGPFLRIVISMLAVLVAVAFLITLVIILLVALLTHGMYI
jgi:hypothetical protein